MNKVFYPGQKIQVGAEPGKLNESRLRKVAAIVINRVLLAVHKNG